MVRIIKSVCVLVCALAFASAQNNIKPIADHGTSTTAANPSANPLTLKGNEAPSVDQKIEAVQAVEKFVQDRSLISTVPDDTWTPMGFTGEGLSWNPFEGLTSPSKQSTYSINELSVTRLPQQLVQQQQEHSLQQQHNILGSTMSSLNADLRRGHNQDAAGGQNQDFGGGNNNMLQTMLLMQLLSAGRDASDPQPTSFGQQVSVSPLEALLRLEESRMTHGRQIDRTIGNIGHSENQRGTQATFKSNQNNRRSIVSIPGLANVPDVPNNPRFVDSQTLHLEAMDRRNITPSQRLAFEFVEPVVQGQTQAQNTDMRSDLRGGSGRRRPPFMEEVIPGRILLSERSGVQRVPTGPSYDLRNIFQVIRDTHFQRNLRTFGTAPGVTANPADVRADQADLMSDYIDNLQSMSPFQRMLNRNPMFGML